MTIKLTKRVIDGLAPPSKGSKIIRDSEVRGLAVRLQAPTHRTPSGARNFIFAYTLHGNEQRIRIGPYPTWSCEAARDEARELRKRVDRGEDPAQVRRDERDAPTIDELSQRYIDEHLPSKSPRAQRNDVRLINGYIKPALGKRRVEDVQVADVSTFHRTVTIKHGPVAANRLIALLSKMFSLALLPAANETRSWRSPADGNPCKGVKRNEEFGRERFYSEAELVRIGDALASYHDQNDADCVRFIMLTGCRPCEAIGAQWSEFDDQYWTKRRTKQKRRHVVPLSPPALELLARRRGEATGGAVFNINTRFGLRGLWEHVRSEAKLGDGARIYDLRHSFASVGAAGGVSLYVIGMLLGHSSPRTTQRYAHLSDEVLRDATARIAKAMTKP